MIGGLTGDQRFFIAYGYSWQNKQREGVTRAQLLTNPHSPAKYRVNGVVRNMDEWYKAFDVKPGDAMYLAPEQRVHHLVGLDSGSRGSAGARGARMTATLHLPHIWASPALPSLRTPLTASLQLDPRAT